MWGKKITKNNSKPITWVTTASGKERVSVSLRAQGPLRSSLLQVLHQVIKPLHCLLHFRLDVHSHCSKTVDGSLEQCQ